MPLIKKKTSKALRYNYDCIMQTIKTFSLGNIQTVTLPPTSSHYTDKT